MPTQAETVGQIALDIDWTIEDSKRMTRSIFNALNKAYEAGERAGFERGFKAATQQQAIMNDLIDKVIGT